jgi:hypothetical protein
VQADKSSAPSIIEPNVEQVGAQPELRHNTGEIELVAAYSRNAGAPDSPEESLGIMVP